MLLPDWLARPSVPLAAEPARGRAVVPLRLLAPVGDVAILLASYAAISRAFDLYRDAPMVAFSRWSTWAATLVVIWLVVAVRSGVYEPRVVTRQLLSPYVAAKVTLLAGAILHLLPLIGAPVSSRIGSAAVVLLLAVPMATWRLLLARLGPPEVNGQEVVVVGAGWEGRTLARALRWSTWSGTRVAAFVDEDPALVGERVEGAPVYPMAALEQLAAPGAARRRVVLAMSGQATAAVYDRLTTIAEEGVEVVSMAQAFEEATGRVPVYHLGERWWASIPHASTDLVLATWKRAVDLLAALGGLVVLGLALPVVAVLMRRESPGPLFFRQERLGRQGRPFTVYKLRTLPAASDPTPADLWSRKAGNRPGSVGAFLRKSGLDELPQCLSILRGEMSVVGPRPYVPEEVAHYQEHIPFFRSRALVRPGLTGWAQVNWSYGLTIDDEIEKLQYDLYYVRHQSIYLDLLIMLRTAKLILSGRPVSREQEQRRMAVDGPRAEAPRAGVMLDVRGAGADSAPAWAEMVLRACESAEVPAGAVASPAARWGEAWTTPTVHCPHAPGDDCDCGDPRTGLLHRAARSLGMDFGRSVLVTDTLAGVVLGLAGGCRVVFVGASDGGAVATPAAVACVRDGQEAAREVLRPIAEPAAPAARQLEPALA